MRVNIHRCHPAAKVAVEELSRSGVVCTADDIVWLDRLARDGDPAKRDPLDWLNAPVMAGNVALYPPTIAAHVWIENGPAKWFADDAWAEMLAMAYACAAPRTLDAFAGMYDRRSCRKALTKWCDGLICTVAELRSAMDRVLGSRETEELPAPVEPQRDPIGGDWAGRLVARLCEKFGGTPGQWLCGVTPAQAADMLAAVCGDDDDKVDARALMAFRAAVASIKERANGNG